MSQSKFPEGWGEKQVRRVLAHYEDQTTNECRAEDEAGIESSETVMNVASAVVAKLSLRDTNARLRSPRLKTYGSPPGGGTITK